MKTKRTSKKTSAKAEKKRNTKLEVFVKKNASDYPARTWVVFRNEDGKRKQPRVFESKLSRDNVRNSYAQSLGCKIQETRSRRVENY